MFNRPAEKNSVTDLSPEKQRLGSAIDELTAALVAAVDNGTIEDLMKLNKERGGEDLSVALENMRRKYAEMK